MAAPRRVFVKIRDFSQDSAALRPKPPIEPKPMVALKLSDLKPSSRKVLVLPKITKPERPPPRRHNVVKSESPSRLEDIRALNYEEVCNPYELEDGPRIDLKLGERKSSFANRIDLRRGSFSKKQIISPRRQFIAPQQSKVVIRPEIVHPPSPQADKSRSRMQQISRRFQISRETLEHKHRVALSEPIPPKPPKPEKSQSVEPALPYADWMSSLGEVTRITDFSLKVKPAFTPKRRVKLTK